MVSRSEAFIITAAVAVAMLPRFEAKVTQFTQQHRTEIQMAVNKIEGQPALPYALPAAPEMPANVELAMSTPPAMPEVAPMRFEFARLRPAMEAAEQGRVQVMRLQPQLASFRAMGAQNSAMVAEFRAMAAQNRAAYTVYRFKAKKCPAAPAAPVAPVALDADSGS